MGMTNPILDRLARGDTALGAWTVTGSPLAVEAMIAPGVDFISVDLQHGSSELSDLRALVTAVEARGLPLVARVSGNDPTVIGRALDLGAMGVIVPLVDDRAAAERAIAACRFAPHGNRSYGPSHVGMAQGTWDPRELERIAVFVMVETSTALANVGEIASTPGLTGIVVGPSDLSIALGEDAFQAHTTPRVVDAIMAIKDACIAVGVAPGIVCPTAEHGARYLAAGFRFMTLGSDVGLLLGGMARLMADLTTARGATV